METSVEFIMGEMLASRMLTQREFDRLSDDEQIDMLAHYMAKQQLTRWQNYRSWLQIEKTRQELA